MRKETNLLGGETTILESGAELALLPQRLQRLVPDATARLFDRFPESLVEAAAKAPSDAIEAALRRLARGRALLELNLPGLGIAEPAETYLRLGETPVLLSGPLTPAPGRSPAALADLLRLVGAVRQQYGFALGLLPPASQLPLSQLAEAFERTYPGELAALPMPENVDGFWAFYENSGAYLCVDRGGATWKFSAIGGDYGPGPPVGAWLDTFFEQGPFGEAWPVGN